MSKPVVARKPNGAEYGFRDVEDVPSVFVIVRYQDGTPYEPVKPVSKMTRLELEAYATELEIETPGEFANVAELREAIIAKEKDCGCGSH